MSHFEADYWQTAADVTQPKRQVADYVEAAGIPVAGRFDSLEEALSDVKRGGTIIMRIEHPGDHDGPSGLMKSRVINHRKIDHGRKVDTKFNSGIDLLESAHALADPVYGPGPVRLPRDYEVPEMAIGQILKTDPAKTIDIFKAVDAARKPVSDYAQYLGMSATKLMDETSFSFWRYQPGINVTIAADDAQADRFHVFASSGRHHESSGPPKETAAVVSDPNGNALRTMPYGAPILDPETTRNIIDRYQTVRQLGRFSANHCPIMEFQLPEDDDELLFLQYHRARDFKQITDSLDPTDYPLSEGWLAADAVRGGLDSPAKMLATLGYPDSFGKLGIPLPDSQTATFEHSYRHLALNEIMVRRTTAQIVVDDFYGLYSNIASHHGPRSYWLKPQTSLAIGRSTETFRRIITSAIQEEAEEAVEIGRVPQIAIEIASDGNKGFIRRDPNNDGVVYS